MYAAHRTLVQHVIPSMGERAAPLRGVYPPLLDEVIARLVWSLYFQHADQVLFSKKILGLFTVTVKVSQVRPLLEQCFGAPIFDAALL